MKVLGVIPARYNSTRLPGKPLLPVAGKPLLQWVLEAASQSRKIPFWLVATDSSLIFEFVKKLGFECKMTSPELTSGSDRVWNVVKEKDVDVIINLQGDEPLIKGSDLDRLVDLFEEKPHAEMATLGHQTSKEDLKNFSRVKVPLNALGEALYFSRFPIPFSSFFSSSFFSSSKILDQRKSSLLEPQWIKDFFDDKRSKKIPPHFSPSFCLTHIGVYAYKKSCLRKFSAQPPVELEKAENLESLRALFMGVQVHVLAVQERTLSVDTPKDKEDVERHFLKMDKKVKDMRQKRTETLKTWQVEN